MGKQDEVGILQDVAASSSGQSQPKNAKGKKRKVEAALEDDAADNDSDDKDVIKGPKDLLLADIRKSSRKTGVLLQKLLVKKCSIKECKVTKAVLGVLAKRHATGETMRKRLEEIVAKGVEEAVPSLLKKELRHFEKWQEDTNKVLKQCTGL